MSFWTALYTLLLKPLELIFEVIYNAAYQNIKNPGLSIIALSLAMNFLVLPLYRRADAMQEEERETEARLNKWVKHIKQNFSGDERTMMLQTYYRQNNYSPTHVLRGAVSLFLEIPFFIAAYRFLSHLSLLNGVSFGPIADLSKPDALLAIGGISVNILPILMTAINIVSSAIYSKGYPPKTKIQLYAMATVFLVLLYNSPAGLVFYWTLNNLFSLVKTIFYKIKNPGEILSFLGMLFGLFLLSWAAWVFNDGHKRKAIFIAFIALIFVLQFIYTVLKKKGKTHITVPTREPDKKVFVLGALLLAVMTGILIPSAVMKSSPQEFVDMSNLVHPLWFVVNSFLLAAGSFLVWGGVFYWLASTKSKPYFECAVWALCGVSLVNYLFFGKNLGLVSSDLIFDNKVVFSMKTLGLNLIVIIAVSALLTIIYFKRKDFARKSLSIVLAALICMSSVNCLGVNKSIATLDLSVNSASESTPHFTLSKSGKNVVVIMLDRAVGCFVPYMLNEKPELKEKFDGFTYYSNTISFGQNTNFGSPALYGGYEYTPIEMNKRNTELLQDKHDEALLLMPRIFDDNGYDVTVLDPTYAGYSWIPDLSIYNDYKSIHRYITKGYFSDDITSERRATNRNRNFFCYSIMKISPVFAQKAEYDSGQYNTCNGIPIGQRIEKDGSAKGNGTGFMDSYNALRNLSNMTHTSDDIKGSFVVMSNDITHDVNLLEEPSYTPSDIVDNTEYDKENTERFTVDNNTIKVRTPNQFSHYDSNMAAMLQLANWFDYLREIGVYDNTRIILVSDHSVNLKITDRFLIDNKDEKMNTMVFFPLLMVKDFGSTGFTTSDEFMTNADVPTLAFNELIDNPVNPATGNAVNNAEKYSHDQYIILSDKKYVTDNNGNTFLPGLWLTVHDSIWDKNNWDIVAENAVLDEYPK